MNTRLFPGIFILRLMVFSISLPVFSQSDLPSIKFMNDAGSELLIHPLYTLKEGVEVQNPGDLIRTENFELLPPQVPNLGTSDKARYIRFSIENLSGNDDIALLCSNSIIDQLILLRVGYKGLDTVGVQGEGWIASGNSSLFTGAYFPLNIPVNESADYILEVKSGKQLLLPLEIGASDTLASRQRSKDLVFAMYFGIALVMLIYNLFIFFSVKDRSYLFYVLNVGFVGMTQLVLNGYGDRFFWPGFDWLIRHDTYLFGALSGITTVLFAQNFLQIATYSKWLNRILNVYLLLYVVSIILAIVGAHTVSYNLINFNAAASFLLLFAAWLGMRRGYRPARFYIIAWTIFLFGVTLFVLKDFGVLPYNNVTIYALPAGSALEMILISIALADRINTLKREKEDSQLNALKALEENERMVREQNIILEAKVDERTRELRQSNQELKEAVQNLKDTQIQLVESEKMASLGQLTAGIAHELNNPINFVSANVEPLRRDVNELMEMIDVYDHSVLDGSPVSTEELRRRRNELDIDLLKDEIPKLLEGIALGAARTAEIVKGLRMFSRLDEQDLKSVNITECLESSLIILRSEIRSCASVSKDYLPTDPINCYPGKLNQVFVNIITNALHAIRKAGKGPDTGVLGIKVTQDLAFVKVAIRDNGVGMDEATRQRVFEPFYTTKSVGEGTGLGMAIVLGIINDHNGKIEVESQAGRGTEIIITLPKNLH